MKTNGKYTFTANYHTHTARCHHAFGTEREYIEAAISRGLRTLGFSDHVPQFFPGNYYSDYRMFPEQTEDYINTLRTLKREYRNDIEILIGFETEYFPEIFDRLIEFLKPYDIDYMILGQHYIDNEYDTRIYSGFPNNNTNYFIRYIDGILAGISTGKFSYIAHPDLFKYTGDPEIYSKHYRRLCEGAKAMNIPLEINFLGLSTNRHYPCNDFFEIAAEVGNEFIFGCDAHEPCGINNTDAYNKAVEFSKKLGIVPIKNLTLRKI